MSSVLRRAYVEVEPDVNGFDTSLKEKLARQDPGGKAGKQVGGQLNRALKRFDLDPIDVKADPKSALAGIAVAEARLRELADESATVEVKVQTERALRQLAAFRKQLGGDESLKVDVDPSPAEAAFAKLGQQLNALGLDAIDIKANPADALFAVKATQERLEDLRDDAGSVDLRIRADEALGKLTALRKHLGDAGGDSAPEFAAKFGTKLGPLLEALPISGPLGVGIAAGAAAAAPLLASVIAGAVIGQAGIGGVVGGLTIAAKDTRVKAAVDGLGERLEARLESAGASFVQPALLGLGDIEHALDTIDINRIFADSAKLVPQLSGGVSSAIADLGGGLEDLVASAGPVIGVISQGIAEIGRTVGAGLSNLADNGPEATVALTDLFTVINGGIRSVLTLVNVLTELYGIAHRLGLDSGLQLALKLTSGEMDNTRFSAMKLAGSTEDTAGSMQIAVDAAKQLAEAQKVLKPAQDAVTQSQQVLQHTLDSLSPKAALAKQNADALRTAYQNLFSATQSQTEANESYQASFDNLAASVKANAGEFKHNRDNLDLHTAAGRSNRDALEDLLTKSNELYFADIAAGASIAEATKKHQARTTAVEKEATKVHLNKGETDKLIATYGRIPGSKTTDLVLDGVKSVAAALDRLYRLQRALALGININLVEGTGTVKDFKAAGGPIEGSGPRGVDSVPIMAAPDEHMWTVDEVDAVGGHGAMYRLRRAALRGELRGYATGGQIARVDTSRRWPFEVNAAKTHIMSQAEAESKVPLSFGHWPSSPSAQRGDSGVWRRILSVTRAAGFDAPLVSAYRPGDPKWHGSGRADDFGGFNQDSLARFWAAKRPLELIHRSATRDYAYTRGVNKGSFNNALMEAHRNHVHVAMDDGGFRVLQPGLNLIPNGTGRPEPIAGPAAMAAMSGPPVDIAPLIFELRAVRAAIEKVAPGVGRHLGRVVGGVDASIGAAAALYSRTPG